MFGFQMTGGKRINKKMVCIRFGKGSMVVASVSEDDDFYPTLQKVMDTRKYKITYETHIDDWLKSHAVVVISMNAALLLKNNEAKSFSKDKKLIKQFVSAMAESYEVLEKMKYKLIPKAQANIIRKYQSSIAFFFRLYDFLPMAKFIDGAFAENAALITSFNQLIEPFREKTPNYNSLSSEAMAKFIHEKN